jgi:hypothetical protein
LLVVEEKAANSGRRITIAGIKLVLLFTHPLLMWLVLTSLLTVLTGRDLTVFISPQMIYALCL